MQKCWVDYDESIAKDVSFVAFLLVLGRYVRMGLHVHHPDTSTAFLYGESDGKVFVEWDNMTYKLNHSLYGLKQYTCLWYEKLSSILEGFGFLKLGLCECVFSMKDDHCEVLILVYVDNLVILCANIEGISWVKSRLQSLLKLNGLGEVLHCLGVTFDRKGNILLLLQAAYCNRVLKLFGMDLTKSVPTPMVDKTDDLSVSAPFD